LRAGQRMPFWLTRLIDTPSTTRGLSMQHFRRFLIENSRGIASVAFVQIAGAGLSLLFSIVLARLLGVAEIGLYFIAIALVEIGAILARLGLEHAVLRFASIAHGRGDRGSMAAIYRNSLGMSLGMAIALALPLWVVTSHLGLGGERAGELRGVLPLLMLAVAPAAALALQAEFFKAIGAPARSSFVQAVVPPLGLLFGVTVLWSLATVTFPSIVLLYVIGLIASVLYAFVAWNQSLPGIWLEPGYFDRRLLVRTGLPLLLFASMNLVMSWTDVLVLGIWSDPAEVGIYGVSMRIASLSVFVLSAVNSIVAPRFAALHARGEHAALSRLAQQSSLLMLLVVAPGILALLLFPELVLHLFGSTFERGAWPLRILTLGQLVNVGTGPVGYLLIMTGNHAMLRNNAVVWAIVNMVGNLILVPHYGAIGAATSTGVSLALMNIASWWMVRKKLNINTLGYLYSRSIFKD
jgi:O-antigen/teichoic acid export membrane protein